MRALAAALLLSLLAGCAGMRLVDAQVQARATDQAIASGARYRFERLPSQADDPARTEQMEAMAEQALAHVGLVRDDAQARYSVQLGARVQSYLADAWGRPLGSVYGAAPYGGVLIGSGGMFGWGLRMPAPTYHRYEVSLLLRDLRGGQLVYETRATHDGPWADAANILPALFDAALRDFPHPPAGIRQINVEIPR